MYVCVKKRTLNSAIFVWSQHHPWRMTSTSKVILNKCSWRATYSWYLCSYNLLSSQNCESYYVSNHSRMIKYAMCVQGRHECTLLYIFAITNGKMYGKTCKSHELVLRALSLKYFSTQMFYFNTNLINRLKFISDKLYCTVCFQFWCHGF